MTARASVVRDLDRMTGGRASMIRVALVSVGYDRPRRMHVALHNSRGVAWNGRESFAIYRAGWRLRSPDYRRVAVFEARP